MRGVETKRRLSWRVFRTNLPPRREWRVTISSSFSPRIQERKTGLSVTVFPRRKRLSTPADDINNDLFEDARRAASDRDKRRFRGVIRGVFEDPYNCISRARCSASAPAGNARSAPGDRKRKNTNLMRFVKSRAAACL